MTAEKYVTLVCDGATQGVHVPRPVPCRNKLPTDSLTATEARVYGLRRRWSNDGKGQDFCPLHS